MLCANFCLHAETTWAKQPVESSATTAADIFLWCNTNAFKSRLHNRHEVFVSVCARGSPLPFLENDVSSPCPRGEGLHSSLSGLPRSSSAPSWRWRRPHLISAGLSDLRDGLQSELSALRRSLSEMSDTGIMLWRRSDLRVQRAWKVKVTGTGSRDGVTFLRHIC